MTVDLRWFLNLLEEEGELLRVRRKVSPKFELPSVAKKARDKAVLFEKVEGSQMRVVSSVLSKRSMLALALKTDEHKVLEEFMKRGGKSILPKIVSRGPVKEVIKTGEEADLGDLPIVTYSEKDVGPFITAGIVIAKDPETKARNVSYNRMQLKGPRKLGIDITPPSDLDSIRKKMEQLSEPLEIAIAIGNFPTEMIAGATRLPSGIDEFELASALRQEPLPLIKCETIDVEVPAYSEVVIEGIIPPNIREPEGPFGEFSGYYNAVKDESIIEIKAITQQDSPIYQTIHCGSLEEHYLKSLHKEEKIFNAIAANGTEVKAISLVPVPFICSISIKKRLGGEPMNVALAALSTDTSLKYCIVVDDDVDVYDSADVFWAIATRSQPDKSIFTVPGALGATNLELNLSKVGIDATAPLGNKDKFERTKIPSEKFKLRDYLLTRAKDS